MIDLTKALFSLYPSAVWTLNGDDYSGLNWLSEDVAKPDEQALIAECNRLQAEYNFKEYQRKRAAEYPAIVDQLDLLYHGGMDAWKTVIQTIKDKYPKG
jgi:hypothetical protein